MTSAVCIHSFLNRGIFFLIICHREIQYFKKLGKVKPFWVGSSAPYLLSMLLIPQLPSLRQPWNMSEEHNVKAKNELFHVYSTSKSLGFHEFYASYHQSLEKWRLKFQWILPIRIGFIKKQLIIPSVWWRCGATGTLTHCWWECKIVQPLWETVWRFLQN